MRGEGARGGVWLWVDLGVGMQVSGWGIKLSGCGSGG